jgi:hypothetical protein
MTQCMEKSAFKYTECIFLCENLAVQFILYNHVVPALAKIASHLNLSIDEYKTQLLLKC